MVESLFFILKSFTADFNEDTFILHKFLLCNHLKRLEHEHGCVNFQCLETARLFKS